MSEPWLGTLKPVKGNQFIQNINVKYDVAISELVIDKTVDKLSLTHNQLPSARD